MGRWGVGVGVRDEEGDLTVVGRSGRAEASSRSARPSYRSARFRGHKREGGDSLQSIKIAIIVTCPLY